MFFVKTVRHHPDHVAEGAELYKAGANRKENASGQQCRDKNAQPPEPTQSAPGKAIAPVDQCSQAVQKSLHDILRRTRLPR